MRARAAFGKIGLEAPDAFGVDAPQADRAKRGKGGASSRAQKTIVTDPPRRLDVGLPARPFDRRMSASDPNQNTSQ